MGQIFEPPERLSGSLRKHVGSSERNYDLVDNIKTTISKMLSKVSSARATVVAVRTKRPPSLLKRSSGKISAPQSPIAATGFQYISPASLQTMARLGKKLAKKKSTTFTPRLPDPGSTRVNEAGSKTAFPALVEKPVAIEAKEIGELVTVASTGDPKVVEVELSREAVVDVVKPNSVKQTVETPKEQMEALQRRVETSERRLAAFERLLMASGNNHKDSLWVRVKFVEDRWSAMYQKCTDLERKIKSLDNRLELLSPKPSKIKHGGLHPLAIKVDPIPRDEDN